MILVKQKPTSSGLRFKSKFKFLVSKKKFKWATIQCKRFSGISRNKKPKVLYKRKPSKFKKTYNANNGLIGSTKWGVFMFYKFFLSDKTFIGVVKFTNGAFTCIKTVHGLKPGSILKSNSLSPYFSIKYNVGDTVLLAWLNLKNIFCKIIVFPFKKCQYSTSPGTFCKLITLDDEKSYYKIQLSSKLIKYLYNLTFVTLGRNSNIFSNQRLIGKAGVNVIRGYKSSVRGVAMNPVDHPHGGRTKTNSPEKTPWGKIAKFNK